MRDACSVWIWLRCKNYCVLADKQGDNMSKPNISGVYSITNKKDGKQYIGSSKSVYRRWHQGHLPSLKNGSHYNRNLQLAWNKNREDFYFVVLEECDQSMLLEREGCWIEKTHSWERELGYNFTRIIDGKQIYSEQYWD